MVSMEVINGGLMPRLYSGSGIDTRQRFFIRGLNRIPCVLNPRELNFSARSLRELSAFDDKRHMECYNRCPVPVPVCAKERNKEKKKKMKAGCSGVSEKKRAKLVKQLAKNLHMFSELGFGLATDGAEVKTISEAALVLQAHLEHLRAEGKKLKTMSTALDDSESSSWSSSESSDSECDNDDGAVTMSRLGNVGADEQVLEKSMTSERHEMMATSAISRVPLEQPCSKVGMTSEHHEAMATSAIPLEQPCSQVGVVGVTVPNVQQNCATISQLKRVEVCMGGKCKKMGAHLLMEEFTNVVGMEALVVGCKCMGKCKTAPNVRILSAGEEDDKDDSVRCPSNPLCLGVGLNDVESLIAIYRSRVGICFDSAASPSAM